MPAGKARPLGLRDTGAPGKVGQECGKGPCPTNISAAQRTQLPTWTPQGRQCGGLRDLSHAGDKATPSVTSQAEAKDTHCLMRHDCFPRFTFRHFRGIQRQKIHL